jgi:hypothetical protein
VSDERDAAEQRSSIECTNRYELIMVAAKEARRLNDYHRMRNVEPKSRVTTEAIRRARTEGVRFTYAAPAPTLDPDPATGESSTDG